MILSGGAKAHDMGAFFLKHIFQPCIRIDVPQFGFESFKGLRVAIANGDELGFRAKAKGSGMGEGPLGWNLDVETAGDLAAADDGSFVYHRPSLPFSSRIFSASQNSKSVLILTLSSGSMVIWPTRSPSICPLLMTLVLLRKMAPFSL